MVDKKKFLAQYRTFPKEFISIFDDKNIPVKYIDQSEYDKTDLFSTNAMIFQLRDIVPPTKQTREFIMEEYKDPVKLSADNVAYSLRGFAFFKNEILYGTFRDELQKLFECGIIDEIEKLTSTARDNLVEYERMKRKIILTWKHLYAGFYIWFGACVVSALAFVVEVLLN